MKQQITLTLNLDIDNEALFDNAIGLLTNLNGDQKIEIAKEVLRTFLRDPEKLLREKVTREIIQQMRDDGEAKSFGSRDKTDEELQNDYRFTRKFDEKYANLTESILSDIYKQLEKAQKSLVEEKVKDDPIYQEIFKEFRDHFKQRLPNMIQDALSNLILKNIQDRLANTELWNTTGNVQQELQELKTSLYNKGLI